MCACFTEDAFYIATEVIVRAVLFAANIAQDHNSKAVLFQTAESSLESVIEDCDKFLIRSLVACIIGQVRVNLQVKIGWATEKQVLAVRLKVIGDILTVIAHITDGQTPVSDNLVVDVHLFLSQLNTLELISASSEHKTFLCIACKAIEYLCALIRCEPLAQDFGKHRVKERHPC